MSLFNRPTTMADSIDILKRSLVTLNGKISDLAAQIRNTARGAEVSEVTRFSELT